MDIPITVPPLLLPAIAIMTLGYINRYIGAAGVIRNFVKDYDSGYKHPDVAKQLKILSKRLMLCRTMLTFSAIALILASLSMLFIYADLVWLGGGSFGASLVAMIMSLLASLYETQLSNASLSIEIKSVIDREQASE